MAILSQTHRRRFCQAGAALFMSALVSLPLGASAQEKEAPLTGEQILDMVRMSHALQKLPPLTGRLRNDDRAGSEYPIGLTMADSAIRFAFRDPNEIIHLELGEKNTRLRRVVAGSSGEVPASQYGQNIRGTAVNYEDLALRFLYWPNGSIVADSDSIGPMKCWVVRVTNPDGRGPYSTVDVWVHKDSGAIAQMMAYNKDGKLLKKFTVVKGQRYKAQKIWILKQMRVEGYDADSGKVTSRTYLEIDNPK